MLNIIHLIPTLRKGGAERLALNIVNELEKIATVKATLICFSPENDYSFLCEKIHPTIIPSVVIPSITGKSTINVAALQQEIETLKPDVIHLHLFEAVMVMSAISGYKGKIVIHFHDNMVQFSPFTFSTLFSKQKLIAYYEKRKVLKAFKHNEVTCIAISKDTFRFVLQTKQLRKKTLLLHNAIDLSRFKPTKQLEKNGVIHIACIGSLVDNKGQSLAIDTISLLKKRNFPVHLSILGDGANRISLQEQIDSLSLNDEVTLCGNVDKPEAYLQRSTLYLHTAMAESFGLVLVEAMACGLPIVATDAGGNRDIVINDVNGYLLPKRSAEDLADKIELILNDDALCQKLAQNSIHYAQQFSITSYTEKLIEMYQKKTE